MVYLHKHDKCPLGRDLSPSSLLCQKCLFHESMHYVPDPWSSYYETECSADESGVVVVAEEEKCLST